VRKAPKVPERHDTVMAIRRLHADGVPTAGVRAPDATGETRTGGPTDATVQTTRIDWWGRPTGRGGC